MADILGRESVPAQLIPDSSISARRKPVADVTARMNSRERARCTYGMLNRMKRHQPLTDGDVLLILSLGSPSETKELLMQCHADGLVTDEQVTRAFADHPELVEA